MPKKLSTSSKVEEARARKALQKSDEKTKKQEELENAKWVDDDKHINRKLERHEDREKKRLEQLAKKKEKEELYEKEMNSIKAAKPTKKIDDSNKLTQFQIEAARRKIEEAKLQDSKEFVLENDKPLEENINFIKGDGAIARTVEDAIIVLDSSNDDADKHPEKRMKAAWLAYYEKRLPELKAEFPSLRLSQLKDRVYKEFQTSPENPKYQAAAAAANIVN